VRPAWRPFLGVAAHYGRALAQRPFITDTLLAVVLAVSTVASHTGAWSPLILLDTLPLAVRRRWPVPVLVVTLMAEVGFHVIHRNVVVLPGTVIGLYTVAAYCSRPVSIRAGLGTAVVLALTNFWIHDFRSWFGLSTAWSVLGGRTAAWMSGAYIGQLRARPARLAREKELQTRRAVAEEQARIARELHDVIAHNVSVMVVQAAAARDVFDVNPAKARAALEAIETAGREAMTELRRLLARVRPEDGEVRLPQPGLARLDGLIEQVRAAGLPVELRIDGQPSTLSPTMELSAYRIIQEALTNTLRHAHASHAAVTVRYHPDHLVVEVNDDGLGDAAPGANSGRGLIGMRERAALFGGSLHAGPRKGGGFVVHAHLPLCEEG
jgi:signal transduction histidine kinase